MIKFRIVHDRDETNGDYITFIYDDVRGIALFWMDGNGCQLCAQYPGDIPQNIDLNYERRLKVVGADLEAIL